MSGEMDEDDFPEKEIARWELIPGQLSTGLKAKNPVGDKITKKVEEIVPAERPKNP